MFTSEKVIDKEKIKAAIAEKKSMTFESVEENLVKDLLAMDELLKTDGINVNQQGSEEINIYDMYLSSFSTILFGLTLDELEFINDNNLFGFDKNNLLDYKCQTIMDERIKDFKQTLDDVVRSISIDNAGSYFQKFGDIHNQARQGIKLNIILGLDRSGVELTPIGARLKSCIDNIRKMHIEFLKNAKTASAIRR